MHRRGRALSSRGTRRARGLRCRVCRPDVSPMSASPLAACQRPSAGAGGLPAAQRTSTRRKPHVDLSRLDVRAALSPGLYPTGLTPPCRRHPRAAAGAIAAQVPPRVQARGPPNLRLQGGASASRRAALAEPGASKPVRRSRPARRVRRPPAARNARLALAAA